MPPTDLARIEKTELGRTAVSEALIKQHPDVLSAPPEVQKQLATSARGRDAITDALLAKYTSTSVQYISPEDLARLKSLNTPRAQEALSIKDADGHLQSFEHMVQFYFTNLNNQGGSQSKIHDIEQWIRNEWHTYFGSLKPLSEHQIHKRLSKVLTNGPYQYSRYGNTVYWARQDS